MRWRIGYRLRNALIIGGTAGMGLFGWQAMSADVPCRPPAVDVCGLVRPEMIARLMPQASPPTIEPGGRGEHLVRGLRPGRPRRRPPRKAELWFGYQRFPRADGESSVRQARDETRSAGNLNNPAGPRPTPVRIGDESYELTLIPDWRS